MDKKYKNIIIAKSSFIFESNNNSITIVKNKWKTYGIMVFLYGKYNLTSSEIYKNDILKELKTETLEKKKITVINKNNKFLLNGPYGELVYSNEHLLLNFWNFEKIKNNHKNKIIDPYTGKIYQYIREDLGNETITINNKVFKVKHYRLRFNNKSSTDIWYNKENKIIIKLIANSNNNLKKITHIISKINKL